MKKILLELLLLNLTLFLVRFLFILVTKQPFFESAFVGSLIGLSLVYIFAAVLHDKKKRSR